MIPSLLDQLIGYSATRPAPKPDDGPINNGHPAQIDLDKATKMLSDRRITARMVQERIGKSISTSQNIMRILCDEGHARRVENGPRGEKGYVKA